MSGRQGDAAALPCSRGPRDLRIPLREWLCDAADLPQLRPPGSRQGRLSVLQSCRLRSSPWASYGGPKDVGGLGVTRCTRGAYEELSALAIRRERVRALGSGAALFSMAQRVARAGARSCARTELWSQGFSEPTQVRTSPTYHAAVAMAAAIGSPVQDWTSWRPTPAIVCSPHRAPRERHAVTAFFVVRAEG